MTPEERAADGGRAYYELLPRKRVAAGALCFDAEGGILVVKPSYRAG